MNKQQLKRATANLAKTAIIMPAVNIGVKFAKNYILSKVSCRLDTSLNDTYIAFILWCDEKVPKQINHYVKIYSYDGKRMPLKQLKTEINNDFGNSLDKAFTLFYGKYVIAYTPVRTERSFRSFCTVYGYQPDKIMNEMLTMLPRRPIIKSDKSKISMEIIRCSVNSKVTQMRITAPSKSIDDIVMHNKEEIVSEVDHILKTSNYLRCKGIKTQIGLLIYGKPGTGKTTFLSAIAKKYNYNMVNISLADNGDINDILHIINRRHGRSILVFDDCDLFLGHRSPGANNQNMKTVMQLLDGFFSDDNTIIALTTNYIDSLDPAIIRSGRINLKIHMDELNKDDAEKLCNNLSAKLSILDECKFPINPAYLQDKIISNIKDNIDIDKLDITKSDENDKSEYFTPRTSRSFHNVSRYDVCDEDDCDYEVVRADCDEAEYESDDDCNNYR